MAMLYSLCSVGPAFAKDDAVLTETQNSSETVPLPAANSGLTMSLGVATWHGGFGAPSATDISSVLVGVRYRRDRLRLSASVPYMRITSNGTFFTGLGGSPLFVAPNITTVARKRDGLGDLTIGGSYTVSGSNWRGFNLDVSGQIKIPTASRSSQLSTGKVDYALGADLSRSFGRWTPGFSASYRIFGNNSVWQFRDAFHTSANVTYALLPRTAVLLSYDYTQAATRFVGDAHEIVAGASTPITDRIRLTGYMSKGLSTGAADVSGGASLSLSY